MAPWDLVVKLAYAGVRTLCRTRRRRLGEEDAKGALMTAMGRQVSGPGAYIIAREWGKAAGRKIEGHWTAPWGILESESATVDIASQGLTHPGYADRR
jgi:hypothetical protein